MGTLQSLQAQNKEISELCQVLKVLLNDRCVCETALCQELYARFADKVRAHLSLEDSKLYSELLSHHDHEIKHLTERFMENSREIKRLFTQYEKHWRKHGKHPALGDEQFITDTCGIFDMILQRIDAETKEFFPAAEQANAA